MPRARWQASGSARRQRDRSPAGTSRWSRIRRAGAPAAFALPPPPFPGCRRSLRRRAILAGQRVPRCRRCRPQSAQPDQLAIDGDLALHQRLGLLDQRVSPGLALTVSIRPSKAGRIASLALAIFLDEFLIAGERKAARRAFGPAQQRPHVRDLASAPPSAWSTEAVSDRDLMSRPIEAAPMMRRIARPIPRMIRCEGIDACYFIFSRGARSCRTGEAFD